MNEKTSDLIIILAQHDLTRDADWKAFVQSVPLSAQLPEGVTSVFYTSWIIDTTQSPTLLGDLLSASRDYGVPIQAFRVFSEKPFLKQNC